MFDNKTEEYLHENHGNLNKFFELVAEGEPFGMAFVKSLSRPDTYRLRKAGKWEDLRTDGEIDSPSALQIIEWLKETAKEYPEDHPVWSLR